MNVENFVSLTSIQVFLFFGYRTCVCCRQTCMYCRDEDCLITCVRSTQLRVPVLADDERVYDAYALQTWLQSSKSTCVLPTMSIRRLHALPNWNVLRRRRLRVATCDAATQTSRAPLELVARAEPSPLRALHNYKRAMRAMLPRRIAAGDVRVASANVSAGQLLHLGSEDTSLRR